MADIFAGVIKIIQIGVQFGFLSMFISMQILIFYSLRNVNIFAYSQRLAM